ncbi:hypothetical protein cypCar_00043275 [Cyprinus carpio]|nr:hypothetical protein cypCar_00043275 [Cyprinus carpio]
MTTIINSLLLLLFLHDIHCQTFTQSEDVVKRPGFQNQAIAFTGSVNPLEKHWNGSDIFVMVVARTLKTQ